MIKVLEAPGITAEVVGRAAKIKVLLMDVDGVMTDGIIHFAPDASGQMVETKGFNSQDGLGMYMCNKAGIRTGVISGRDSQAVVARAKMLHITYVYQGLMTKDSAYEEVLRDAQVSEDQVAFIGDDFTDARLMKRSGLAVAVANARAEVKEVAHFVTTARGGQGAVREVVELLLKAQGLWDQVLADYALS